MNSNITSALLATVASPSNLMSTEAQLSPVRQSGLVSRYSEVKFTKMAINAVNFVSYPDLLVVGSL